MSEAAKQAKQVVIDEIKEKFENASSVVAVDYLGITVEEADAFTAPDWFGEDVTNDRRYHNSEMVFGNPLK